ncbi:hypothetical protein TrRE_jg6695 [Triparma retinervis]|uniref:H/ACA ribonucleoprotein complex subunit n=1 Tax=Triparma retinervis TaxID=2557542 RepID=A0A9W7FDZ8_9STRA|nr:hypothetical protein TrRE_jg6695 [Triparma retinervis]
MICKVLDECGKVPYFNAPIYLENIKKIGKVDEVFGRVDHVMFTVKPDPGVGLSGWEKGDKVFIGPDKLLPLSRFTDTGKKAGGGGRGGGGRDLRIFLRFILTIVMRKKSGVSPNDLLRKVNRLPGNKVCADCPERLPQYVNSAFLTFVCTNCAGIHRR